MVNASRGLAVTAADVMVTRGSQQALSLAARALLRPGDLVAVDALGYDDGWAALRAAGARLIGIPVDRHGMVISRLAAVLERRPVRAVYRMVSLRHISARAAIRLGFARATETEIREAVAQMATCRPSLSLIRPRPRRHKIR